MNFRDKPDLAARKYGSSVLYATDDFFAEKENLLKPEKPVFLEGEYTDRGKWMDGWESRRKRDEGHDFAIIRLGMPGIIEGVVVDTAFFRGNFPAGCSIDGVSMPGKPTVDELLNAPWLPLLSRVVLKGDSENVFEVFGNMRVTHLRFNIFPDGGVARLRVHGTVLASPRWMGLPGVEQELDLASLEHGAEVIDCNDMFFGSRHNLIGPGRAANMGDGWETKRSRSQGPDWVIVKLAARGTIQRAFIDTLHFKGNYPESAALYGADLSADHHGAPRDLAESAWTQLLPRTKLQAHTQHVFEEELASHPAVTHVRMRIWPDGGVSRLRLFGFVDPEAKAEVSLHFLNAVPPDERARIFFHCASSQTFAHALAERAPYASLEALLQCAKDVFLRLEAPEWADMFAGHPRIGEVKHDHVAMKEQRGMDSATTALRTELAHINQAYENKFGHIYLVCAAGKSATELLDIGKARLQNTAAQEQDNARSEQQKITELRLSKLVTRR
jgi:allantoicase